MAATHSSHATSRAQTLLPSAVRVQRATTVQEALDVQVLSGLFVSPHFSYLNLYLQIIMSV